MSLVKDILRTTARYYPIGNRQLYEYLYEESVNGKKINKRSISAIVSRLKKNGFLVIKDNKLTPTSKAREYLEKITDTLKNFANPNAFQDNRGKAKKVIVIFDIPEKLKLYRNWLRSELVGFGFTMIQKSVWLGPGVSKEFVEYLNEVGILKYLRFFQATEKELI